MHYDLFFRNIELIEITTTTIADFTTTPAPLTMSDECSQSCPELSFLIDSQCPVNCVPLDEQPISCHMESTVANLRPPRELRHCFILGIDKYTKNTCSGVCNSCSGGIDVYTGLLSHSCASCKPSKTTEHQMRLRCPDGSQPKASYFTIDECSCE